MVWCPLPGPCCCSGPNLMAPVSPLGRRPAPWPPGPSTCNWAHVIVITLPVSHRTHLAHLVPAEVSPGVPLAPEGDSLLPLAPEGDPLVPRHVSRGPRHPWRGELALQGAQPHRGHAWRQRRLLCHVQRYRDELCNGVKCAEFINSE